MKLSQKSIAMLAYLRDKAANRLEIEMATGYAPLNHQISSLMQDGYIKSQPKVRRELVKYELTKKGANAIGVIRQREESVRYRPISELPAYVPVQTHVREGSMRAYALPSRGIR